MRRKSISASQSSSKKMNEFGVGLILSSTEGLPIVRAVQEEFSGRGLECVGWHQAQRHGMLLPELKEEIGTKYQYAIFIFTPDDSVKSRNRNYMAPRDNVLFEMGLWLGSTDLSRIFVIAPQHTDVKIPTDLSGLLVEKYNETFKNPAVTFSPICDKIIKRLEKVSMDNLKRNDFEIIPFQQSYFDYRLNASKGRILSARKNELIKFIAVTGKNIISPDARPGEPKEFTEAVRRGVRFKGLLLHPKGDQAKLRARIESPGTAYVKSLLYQDAKLVRDWLRKKHESDGFTKKDLMDLELRYSSHPLFFSLWIFNNYALIEPYHFAKYDRISHLCGFTMLKVNRGTHEYDVLDKHFDLIWDSSTRIS